MKKWKIGDTAYGVFISHDMQVRSIRKTKLTGRYICGRPSGDEVSFKGQNGISYYERHLFKTLNDALDFYDKEMTRLILQFHTHVGVILRERFEQPGREINR